VAVAAAAAEAAAAAATEAEAKADAAAEAEAKADAAAQAKNPCRYDRKELAPTYTDGSIFSLYVRMTSEVTPILLTKI
jgi:hypothetical protein